MLTQFLPKSTTEWTYIILIVLLVITLIVFYKGIMKCKSIIENYNNEIRDYKKHLTLSGNFISYVEKNNPGIISDYCFYSDTNYQDIYNIVHEDDTDNA